MKSNASASKKGPVNGLNFLGVNYSIFHSTYDVHDRVLVLWMGYISGRKCMPAS